MPTHTQTLPESNQKSVSAPPASLWRRMAAMVYDGLLLIALNAIVGTILISVATPPSAAQQHQVVVLSAEFRYLVLLPAMILVTGLFYTYFWTHSQQTLGMQTWHIKVERMDQATLRWRDAAIRYLWSLAAFFPVGIGYWWQLIDREQLALHDRLSGTRMVYAPPPQKPRRRLRMASKKSR